MNEASGGGREGGKAASATGFELGLKCRQNGPVDDRGKSLGESIDGGESDGAAGDARMAEQINHQGGQQRQIDGRKTDQRAEVEARAAQMPPRGPRSG